MKLSIVIPVYNEERTLAQIVQRVLATPQEKEILLVDDGSRDRSREIMAGLEREHPGLVRCFYHEQNRGKGGALKTGFREVRGDFVLIQDADLEYDPADYSLLLAPIERGQAKVVYGSRFLGRKERVHFLLHTWANRGLTCFSNLMTGYRLTDMLTCYKVFPAAVARELDLRSNRFDIEPELTAAFARLRLPLVEVPISYANRTYGEGKKIGMKDGFQTAWAIVRFFFRA